MKFSRSAPVILLFALLLGLWGCRDSGPSDPTQGAESSHIHQYQVTVTPPTCTQEGYTTHTCPCGHSFTDAYLPATEHSWGQWVVTIEPTPVCRGQARRSCDHCGKTEEKILEKSLELH